MTAIIKLNSEVDADLLKVGELRLVVGTGTNSIQMTRSTSAQNISIVKGDGRFANYTPPETDTNVIWTGDEKSITMSEGVAEVSVPNKYPLLQLNLSDQSSPINIDDLAYCDGLVRLRIYAQGCSGNIGSLADKPKLNDLVIASSTVTGDINDLVGSFSGNNYLKYVSVRECSISGNIENWYNFQFSYLELRSTNVEGSIEGFDPQPNLGVFSCGITNLTGTVENFLRNQYDNYNGRQSGILYFNCVLTGVTYKGNLDASAHRFSFEESGVWEVNSDGEHIDEEPIIPRMV